MEPLTPPDCDLRDFAFMPLDVVRLRDSDLAALEAPEACWAAVLLWCASWHQIPAASLPDDDRVLANLAGFGRVVKEWQRVRSGALRGWVMCSDGRLYHPVIAEKANDAWNEKHAYRERKAKRIAAAKVAAESKWEKYRGEEEIQTNSELRSQRIKDARKKGVHTDEQWVAILNACGNKCVKCGSSESIVKDHICPIYKGGSDGIDNIQPLCRSCNSSKGADETDNRPSAVIRLSQTLNREHIDLMSANRRHSAADATCRKGEGQEQGEVKGQEQGEGQGFIKAKAAHNSSGQSGTSAADGKATPGEEMAEVLCKLGVAVGGSNAVLNSWINDGITLQQLQAAIEIAREPHRKPAPEIIHPKYLDAIVRDDKAGKSGAKAESPWWKTEEATVAKGKEFGCSPNTGESWDEFRARLRKVMQKRAEVTA